MTPADRLAESDVVRLSCLVRCCSRGESSLFCTHSSSGTGVNFDGDEDCCKGAWVAFQVSSTVARRGGHATSKHRVRNASSTIVHYPPVAH
ncbi:hypothetical protein KCU83_g376, partial [Aureobasidium melanogenum]